MNRTNRIALLAAFGLTAGTAGGWRAPAASSLTVQPAAAAESLWLATADTGNRARYRVREQLVGFDLPNDAVGTTGAVTGAIVIGADGRVSPRSRFVVELTPLNSDQDRRDAYVRNRILETATHPTVTLAVTSVGNLKVPLPKSGNVAFDLVGDLTVKGVTKPSTWKVAGTIDGGVIHGTASTSFTFADYQLLRPRVPIVLSVSDTIKLEYDFRLVRK